MKTYHIKDLLKKELLILELPRVCDYELDEEMIWVINLENGLTYRAEGSYALLGKPSEIKEEDARELVQYLTRRDLTITPKNYLKGKDGRFEDITFTESLLSAIESVIFWENPYSGVLASEFPTVFEKFESRTFDRNRTLIFVKN